jgi:hypothetical protein
MNSEPFRFDQHTLDVSDMNITSGLRSSLNPLGGTHRLGLSSDLPSSLDGLGRSSDGGLSFLGVDSPFGSSPALMSAHQKAMNGRQLATPLSSAVGVGTVGSSLAAGASAVLPMFGAQTSQLPPTTSGATDGNVINVMQGQYLSAGRIPGNTGPQPVIQIPSGLQASGPTLSDAMAAGVSDAESLRAVQQAALQQTSPSPFNMSQFLQSQSPSTPSVGGVPSVTASGQLRYSGDRYASAFSPVSPGGTSVANKAPSNPYTPSSTPSGQVLSPLAHMTHNGTTMAFGGPKPDFSSGSAVGSPSPSTPFSPSSSSYSGLPLETLVAHSNEMRGIQGHRDIPIPNLGPFGMPASSSAAPPPHKRPYLGSNGADNQVMQLVPGYRPQDGMSDDSARTSVAGSPSFGTDDARTHTLLTSLSTFGQGIALANNAVKQENMVQEHMLGHGILGGPASAAFTYQGKAIPYSEEAARQHYMLLEESKKAELVHIQSHLGRVKRTEALANGTDDNFLSDTHMEHRRIKKLHPLTYDALYRAIVTNAEGMREKYLLNEHPQVELLSELPGRVYFLQVAKGSRKPPHVGFPFRSYSDSHYTSVDRETPVICKVKEWPVDNDPKNIWRLYHYYLGNKKRAPRKRKRSDDSDAD